MLINNLRRYDWKIAISSMLCRHMENAFWRELVKRPRTDYNSRHFAHNG
jgi:hypothetical protein